MQTCGAFETGRRSRAGASGNESALRRIWRRAIRRIAAIGLKLVTFLDQEVGSVRKTLWIFAAAVGCVLLIACSNVASLLLARGAVRVREMAVRAAVGASRGTLIRQLLIESGMLAIAGALLGLPLAIFGVRLLIALDPQALPRAQEIHMDGRVLAFSFLLALATALIFGIVPALRGSRVGLRGALTEGGRGELRRTRRESAAIDTGGDGGRAGGRPAGVGGIAGAQFPATGRGPPGLRRFERGHDAVLAQRRALQGFGAVREIFRARGDAAGTDAGRGKRRDHESSAFAEGQADGGHLARFAAGPFGRDENRSR